MSSSPFLPLPAGLDIARTETTEDQVVVEIISTRTTSSCPLCFSPSSPIQSRSTRTTVRKVGLADWSLKKGHSYGTLFVDLETRRPVDLIADRTAEAVLPWLTRHPDIDLVTRDRAGASADAVRTALPSARQVADQ